MVKAIDIWFNYMSPELQKKLFGSAEVQSATKTEKLDRGLPSIAPDDLVARMDEAGVEVTLLTTIKQGHTRRMGLENEPRLIMDVSYKEILPYLEKYPQRFRGMYGVNPWTVMDGVRELEMVVKEYGFVGAVTIGGGFAPFNDKIWFPFYTKCVELDIPFMAQIGHFAEAFPEGAAHPLQVDDVAEIFPELRIVAGHTGWPWCDVLQAVALKRPNVYIGMEAHMPKYWEPSLVKFINSRGRDRGMWGTDWPVTEAKPNLEQLEQLGLREETMRKLLRENAIEVFKLDLPL